VSQSSREIYWSAILADFHRSGLTHVQFCQLRRISLHSFRSWLYRLRPGLPPRRSTRRTNSANHVPAGPETPAFLPVHVAPQPRAAIPDHHALPPSAPLELVLGQSCHLRVPKGFDPATLHQLLDVLEQRA
jgi:hypothetical protein